MSSQDERNRKIIIEFCHLLEKSKQLFNGLRELPPYGHKQWHVHFGKTFDVYTKLWKFQQQHRELLDTKYGLKRWQIGEIASKIGQLYYHFYLRTSDTAYLSEAFAFYYAIRGRSYYTRACREDRSELMVKKLRYYARFMVVCILLQKIKMVKDLIKELNKQIIEYGTIYDPDDQIEWTLVLDEVKAFVRAEPGVAVVNAENIAIILTHRLTPHSIPPIERSSYMNLKLQEALIIGSNSYQVKFSELTMDMFRILQIIEREPTGDVPHLFEEPPRNRYTGVPEPSVPKDDGPPRRDTGNPHKFLLYKPSPNQVMVYLASSCDELTPNGAVLLYLSAEGHTAAAAAAASAAVASTSTAKLHDEGFDTGGLITTSKSDVYRDYNKETRSTYGKCKEGQCLYPGDIHPFTRKPLFIIIDSDNSFAFQNIPRHFGQPLVILMSPINQLPALQERRHQGNLFTLFLQAPIVGLAMSCELDTIPLNNYDRCLPLLSSFMAETNAILARTRLDSNFYPFMGDDFLRTILYRYIFCEVTLRMHRGFRNRSNFPKCNPPIPDEVFDRPALVDLVLEISNCLTVRQFFHDTYLSGANTNV
ncbi:protein SCAI [Epargyreus clarus]|uniref:protein SCAI n=1 Tax=Epargyreus clarus TaxID=520877 RepID=UPI003C2B9A85